ncbi:MAG: type II secretion system protein [Butyrivibrio sp.]|nr:type II secretion system protein [Butyrivibrio sp.]
MKNNKGFSLVELIIVIAIMAVLVAVLAPQFLKYVEKSRNATDAQNATAIVSAIQTCYADPDTAATDLPANNATTTITVNATGITGADTFVTKAFTDAGLSTSTNCKSKQTWKEYTIKYTVTNGTITFTYGGTEFNNYMTKGSAS